VLASLAPFLCSLRSPTRRVCRHDARLRSASLRSPSSGAPRPVVGRTVALSPRGSRGSFVAPLTSRLVRLWIVPPGSGGSVPRGCSPRPPARFARSPVRPPRGLPSFPRRLRRRCRSCNLWGGVGLAGQGFAAPRRPPPTPSAAIARTFATPLGRGRPCGARLRRAPPSAPHPFGRSLSRAAESCHPPTARPPPYPPARPRGGSRGHRGVRPRRNGRQATPPPVCLRPSPRAARSEVIVSARGYAASGITCARYARHAAVMLDEMRQKTPAAGSFRGLWHRATPFGHLPTPFAAPAYACRPFALRP
jgi:hypothetical protein